MNKFNIKRVDCIIGKIIESASLSIDKTILTFYFSDNSSIQFDSRPSNPDVYIDDICGDFDCLLGVPLLVAESSSKSGDVAECEWVFYIFSTIKGTINIRWFDTTSDYYCAEICWIYIDSDGNKNYG
jgi:hypothetical protein